MRDDPLGFPLPGPLGRLLLEVRAPLGVEDVRVGLTRLPCRDARRETVEWTVARASQRNIFRWHTAKTQRSPWLRGNGLTNHDRERRQNLRFFFPFFSFFQTATFVLF